MKLQRHRMFFYFFFLLILFYVKYVNLLRNKTKFLDTTILDELDSTEPTLFKNEYLVFYSKKSPLARKVAIRLGEFLRFNVISISVFNLDHCDTDYRPDDATNYLPEDRTRPEGQFKIIVDYEDTKNDTSFSLRVKGGSTLVFTVYSNTVFSEPMCERMFSLSKKLFLDSGPIKMKQLKPMLDLNFVLMSDENRVSWDLTEKVLAPYMNYVFSVFSLFYDVYLHSRVVSNVDFLQKFNLDVTSDEDSSNPDSSSDSSQTHTKSNYVLFDLNKQDTNFYNFFEGVANVDVSLKDQHSYRHSLNFFVLLPSKPLYLKDPFTGQKRESFMVDNLGVFTFLNNRTNGDYRKSNLNKNKEGNDNEDKETEKVELEEKNKEENEKTKEKSERKNRDRKNGKSPTNTYVLNDEDALELVSSWVTYIRQMHHLPASKSEFMFWMSNPNEKIKMLSENQFLVSSNSYSFKLTFDDPVGVAFYGFEINKLSTFFYYSYIKGSIKNLRKLPDLAKISFNTQLDQSTFETISCSFDALELGIGYAPPLNQKAEINGLDVSLQAMDTNLRALALARHAYFKSLEALSDDKMYNRNVLSYEHMLGVFMCDVFPYAFPVVLFYFKYFLERFRRD